MRVLDAAGPLAHGLADRVLERARAAVHRVHLRAQQPHAVDIERLPLGVLAAHEHLALHAHERGDGRGSNAVLSRAGFCDHAGLAHLFRQQHLSQHVVDLVRARVVEVLALEVDLRAAEVARHVLRVVQTARAARIAVE